LVYIEASGRMNSSFLPTFFRPATVVEGPENRESSSAAAVIFNRSRTSCAPSGTIQIIAARKIEEG